MNLRRREFDLDELFPGAVKGWLAGTCALLVWFSFPCACELGLVGTFVAFEIFLSLWFLGLVVVVGVPCFHFLGRLYPAGSAIAWGAVGAIAFAAFIGAYVELAEEVSIGDALIYTTLAAIGGGVTLYFVKRNADADVAA